MNFKQIISAAALAVCSVSVLATPQFTGDTRANFDATSNSGEFANTGYYIWNEEGNTKQYHIRWTDQSNGGGTTSWYGNLNFFNSDLDQAVSWSFENTQDVLSVGYDVPFLGGADAFAWTSITNQTGGIDGVSFTLEDNIELVNFNLGASYLEGLTQDLTDPGVASTDIYIGSGLSGTNVLVNVTNSGRVYQSFEIPVSEPGTLALFGLGLAGLGLARRKQKQA